MKLMLLASAVALSFAASAQAAMPTAPGADLPQTTEPNAEPVGYYWRYRSFWRGNCFYRTLYVTNGYRWRYRWRRTCY
jgi:hypothetical protein